jgi:hypothetical protein
MTFGAGLRLVQVLDTPLPPCCEIRAVVTSAQEHPFLDQMRRPNKFRQQAVRSGQAANFGLQGSSVGILLGPPPGYGGGGRFSSRATAEIFFSDPAVG